MPLIAGYAYHKGNWKNRKKREFSKMFPNKSVKF